MEIREQFLGRDNKLFKRALQKLVDVYALQDKQKEIEEVIRRWRSPASSGTTATTPAGAGSPSTSHQTLPPATAAAGSAPAPSPALPFSAPAAPFGPFPGQARPGTTISSTPAVSMSQPLNPVRRSALSVSQEEMRLRALQQTLRRNSLSLNQSQEAAAWRTDGLFEYQQVSIAAPITRPCSQVLYSHTMYANAHVTHLHYRDLHAACALAQCMPHAYPRCVGSVR